MPKAAPWQIYCFVYAKCDDKYLVIANRWRTITYGDTFVRWISNKSCITKASIDTLLGAYYWSAIIVTSCWTCSITLAKNFISFTMRLNACIIVKISHKSIGAITFKGTYEAWFTEKIKSAFFFQLFILIAKYSIPDICIPHDSDGEH